MHSFQSPRLNLRPIAEYDQALYCRLYTDPEVMRHIAPALSLESAQRAFAAVLAQSRGTSRQTPPSLLLWVLSERASFGDIGILALISRGDINGALELGIMLQAEGRNRGVATEALTALMEITFCYWPHYRIWTRHAPGNAAVARLMLKLGFEPEANGNIEVNCRWQMTSEHWLALRAEADVARMAEVG